MRHDVEALTSCVWNCERQIRIRPAHSGVWQRVNLNIAANVFITLMRGTHVVCLARSGLEDANVPDPVV